MGFHYLAARQTSDITLKRLKIGNCYIYKDQGQIIATVTYYRHKTDSEHKLYLHSDVATYGQLAVHPDFQKKGLASLIIKFVEQLAKKDNAKRIVVDTAEKNEKLVNYYKNKGYTIIDHTNWSTTNYTSVLLCKDL